jgi:hypothetical protein
LNAVVLRFAYVVQYAQQTVEHAFRRLGEPLAGVGQAQGARISLDQRGLNGALKQLYLL